ncbi:MAG: peptide-methionine (S)-S-oxide reductase MsrA [Anaerolineales bacterium]|jgi:peptide-methionine (S)-S-oxide reductase|nr:peptide-methionine (S)-S-oxide reductase MsrA [Anaerolineales bacterium]
MLPTSSQSTQTALLGGGCFWCLEAIFNDLQGVQQVVSGYAGGHIPNPSYKMVCTGATGHAEVVQIRFDPNVISYRDLLRVFFSTHDPTTLNRQGADIGTQYRSAIFWADAEQQRIAKEVIAEIEATGIWPNPIVTELAPAGAFYPAEDYHQEYYRNNSSQPYCQFVIAPKLAKFRKEHLNRLRKSA